MEFSINITVSGNGKTYKKNYLLKAKSKEEIFAEIANLNLFNKRLIHEDLQFVAGMVKEKPQLIPAIKEIIEDLQNKNMAQMVASAPKHVRKLGTILKDN